MIAPETIMFFIAVIGVVSLSMLVYAIISPEIARRGRLRRRIGFAIGNREIDPSTINHVKDNMKRTKSIQSRLREAEDSKEKAESRLVRYRNILKQAGVEISLKTYLYICAGLALVSGVLYLLSGYPPVATPAVALCVGFGLPRFIVGQMRKSRTKKFVLAFPDAVDIIVRGVRTGLPVSECLTVVYKESPEPVAGVFREIVEAQRLGLTLEDSINRALLSMPLAELRFFGIVLVVQQQTGGNLAETLANLSNILRGRKKMSDKVKALSAEAKSGAMIIGSLPFCVCLLLSFTSPDYLSLLFTEQLGNIMIMAGLIWMGIGIFTMKQMVSFEI